MKNTNDNKSKIKKQILSGAVYIALAVTVFAFTVNTITSSFTESVGNAVRNAGGASSAKDDAPKTYYENPVKIPITDFNFDTPVSDTKSGVDATVVPPQTETQSIIQTGEEELREKTEEVKAKPEKIEDQPEVPDESPEPENKKAGGEEPEDVFDVQYVGFDGFIYPCGGFISKEYSVDLPVYSATMYDYRTHPGIDIACEVGSIVRASSNGEISEIYDDPLMGRTLVIAHKDGLTSVYGNLSPDMPAEIFVGKNVITGETIGGVGNSALCESAEASHLHFEMRKDGNPVNPEDYLIK